MVRHNGDVGDQYNEPFQSYYECPRCGFVLCEADIIDAEVAADFEYERLRDMELTEPERFAETFESLD